MGIFMGVYVPLAQFFESDKSEKAAESLLLIVHCIGYFLGIKAGLLAGDENPLLQPFVEILFCPGVSVPLVGVFWKCLSEIDPYYVIRAFIIEFLKIFGSNDIIGRGEQVFARGL